MAERIEQQYLDAALDVPPARAIRIVAAHLQAESRTTEGQGFDPWEALSRWRSTHGGRAAAIPEATDNGDYIARAGTLDGRTWEGQGGTPFAAALDLCRKLGLLPKGPNNG